MALLITLLSILGVLIALGVTFFVAGYRKYFIEGKGRASYNRDGDGLMLAGGMLFFIPLIIGTILSITVLYDAASCQRYGSRVGYETEWQFVGGCYVQVNDRMVPQDWIVPVVEGELLRLEVVNPVNLP
jgi:heme/copper-type cytochrome/quinol oxidase subunit 2